MAIGNASNVRTQKFGNPDFSIKWSLTRISVEKVVVSLFLVCSILSSDFLFSTFRNCVSLHF